MLKNVSVESGEQTLAIGDLLFLDDALHFVALNECVLMGTGGTAGQTGLLAALTGGAILGGLVIGTFADQNRGRIDAANKQASLARRRQYAWTLRERISAASTHRQWALAEISDLSFGGSGLVIRERNGTSTPMVARTPFSDGERAALERFPEVPPSYDDNSDEMGLRATISPVVLAAELASPTPPEASVLREVADDPRYGLSLFARLLPALRDGDAQVLDNLRDNSSLSRALLAALEEERKHDEGGTGWLVFGGFALLLGLVLGAFELLGGLKNSASVVMWVSLAAGALAVTRGVSVIRRTDALFSRIRDELRVAK